MNKNTQSILEELYHIDPDLKQHEKELLPLIETLLKAKPNTEADPSFVEEVRRMLKLKMQPSDPSSKKSMQLFSPLLYTLSGLTAGVLVAAFSGVLPLGNRSGTPATSTAPLFAYKVEDAGSNAFGTLRSPIGGAQEMATGRGGGGGGGGGGVPLMPGQAENYGTDAMVTMPAFQQYTFTFDGELPPLEEAQLPVLKRVKEGMKVAASTLLRGINIAAADLSSFEGGLVDSVSFYQDKQYGYQYFINFREGTLNINQFWEKWPHPEASCRDEACFERYRMQPEDVLDDAESIAIATAFLERHSIDTSSYGEPVVDNNWRIQYERAPDTRFAYVPDVMRVLFPLQVEGQTVYDESGVPAGLSVGVSAKEKKVSDVGNITNLSFERSLYNAVTEHSRIQQYLGALSRRPQWMPNDATIHTVQVTLGTPEKALMRFYRYENAANDELVIPALIFPITNVSDGSAYYGESLVVPLIEDVLQTMEERVTGGGVQPVEPLPLPAAMSGDAEEDQQ